jgi:hypothetical protein
MGFSPEWEWKNGGRSWINRRSFGMEFLERD